MENISLWQSEKCLGRGAFGEVQLFKHSSENSIVVKVFLPHNKEEKVMPQNRELIPTEERIYLKEKKAQELIEHENIVKAIKIPQELLEVVREKYGNLPKIFALGMEYANKGTVSSLMQEPYNKTGLTESVIDLLCGQLSSALHYMHGKNYFHLDLKDNNVLVFETPSGDLMFKLCDFSHLSQTENLSKRFIGVQAYTFPGSGSTDQFSAKQCDIYALGVLLYFSITGTYPFSISDRENNKDREDLNTKNEYQIRATKSNSTGQTFHEDLPDQTHLCWHSKRYYEKILQSLLDVRPASKNNDWRFGIQANLDSKTVTIVSLQQITIENIPFSKEAFAKATLSDVLKVYAQKKKLPLKYNLISENGDILSKHSKLSSIVFSVSKNVIIFLMNTEYDYSKNCEEASRKFVPNFRNCRSPYYHVASVFSSKLNIMHSLYKAAKNLCSAMFTLLSEEWNNRCKEALTLKNKSNQPAIDEAIKKEFNLHLMTHAGTVADSILDKEIDEKEHFIKGVEQTRDVIYEIIQHFINKRKEKAEKKEELSAQEKEQYELGLFQALSDFDANVLKLVQFTYRWSCTAISQTFKLQQFIKMKTSKLKKI